MNAQSATLLIALSLCVESCASPAEEHPRVDDHATAPAVAAVAPAVPDDVLATLQEAAVTHDAYARRVLYTWSTPEGAAKIRAAGKLLLPTAQEGQFVAEIESLAASAPAFAAAGSAAPTLSSAHDVAQLLSKHPSFATRRYAWTRPFATREPLADRSYGDQLIAVTLKPNAVIARFDARDEVPFRFSDLEGNEVPLGRVLADPSVLAAVYHVGASPESGTIYREYVLCNEAMIAEWSIGTEAIARVIEADARAVNALAALAGGASGVLLDEPASPRWEHAGEGVGELYAVSLAFDTERHRPTRENLTRLSGLLEAVEARGKPMVVVPTITFISQAVAPPPVPPLPPGFGVKKRKFIYLCD